MLKELREFINNIKITQSEMKDRLLEVKNNLLGESTVVWMKLESNLLFGM